MERQSSAASSTDETSGPLQDFSGGSKREEPDFGVFKDFDFLEYESESIEGESTDNFNWGVRRRPISEGDSEPLTGSNKIPSHLDESLSEKTPVMNKRRHRVNAEDSSDEEAESESPLDEDQRPLFNKSSYLTGPPTTLCLGDRRQRRDSVSRSDTSGSSVGDLGDITPCNASPHLTGMISFRAPIRDESEETWRRTLQELLFNQPSSYAPDLLNQLYRLLREITMKCVLLSRESIKFFSGIGTQLGNRITVLADLLSGKEETPRIWYNQSNPTTPRLFETLRFGVLEVQEHLETFFDRKDHVIECLDSVKTSCKLALYSDMDPPQETMSQYDASTTEIIIDLGRALYKLMFQLLLIIECDHKIAITIYQNLKQNERLQDLSHQYVTVKNSLLRTIDDTEMDSLDTSTSTEGENTPTPSPVLPLSLTEIENALIELIEHQK